MLFLRPSSRYRRLLVLSAALAAAAPGAALGQADSGALIIRQAGQDIGREDFVLREDRGPGVTGTTILSTTRFPVLSPQVLLRGRLERGTDGGFLSLRLDVQNRRESSQILAEAGPRLVTVRGRLPTGEMAREFPGGPNVVLLDDSVFAWYAAVADLATEGGQRLVAIYPRTGRRGTLVARREAAPDGGRRVLLSGEVDASIWLDAEGHLERLQFPRRNLDIVRLPH